MIAKAGPLAVFAWFLRTDWHPRIEAANNLELVARKYRLMLSDSGEVRNGMAKSEHALKGVWSSTATTWKSNYN